MIKKVVNFEAGAEEYSYGCFVENLTHWNYSDNETTVNIQSNN